MSATVKLSSKLPGDPEINGLDALHAQLTEDATPVLCLAWIVPSKVTRDIGTEVEIPTVEVRRIEPIGNVGEAPQAIIDLAAELYEQRTGRNPLPIGELMAPAGDVDKLEDNGWERPAGEPTKLGADDFEGYTEPIVDAEAYDEALS